ncbi:MAG: carboxyl transferase [Lachnospiraceae bacterium]|nr:carboxyl transferase [Lachnospiraceae bacterium]
MGTTAKLSASDRIQMLLDDNSFVEIGGLVTARSTDFNLSSKNTPADGVITGYGVIDGGLVYVYSQDASVLNGSMGEMHAKKICKIYELAMKVGAPVIGLVDCSGFRLQEATDALQAFGEIYKKQVTASGLIPQITAIFGTCGGGLSLIPALTDFTFMADNAKLFVNSPNAIPANDDTKCNSSAAVYQSEVTGNVDFTGTEEEVLLKMRQLVAMLPANCEEEACFEITDDMNRMCADIANCDGDTALALSMIADNHLFMEIKPGYAKEMVAGLMKLNGMTVGAVANRTKVYGAESEVVAEYEGALTADGCEKAAEFVNFCDAFNIPVVTLTDAVGFAAGLKEEKSVAKAAAKLTYAFAAASVPKVNVMIGKAYGSAYNVMNSKALGADMVYAWESAEIGMMDAELAVKIIYADEIEKAADKKSFIAEKTAEYQELQNGAVSAARRGYVDAMIAPESTRKYIIGALEMLYSKKEERPNKKHGTV